MTERSAAAHRTSFGARDAEVGLVGDAAGNGAAVRRAAYDPKVKVRGSLLRQAVVRVQEFGVAKLVSGAVSVFLLLSIFLAISGGGGGSDGNAGSIHLRARELLPIAVPRVPPVKVDKSRFVQRRGPRLVLSGKDFKFAGASNYYMLTRAVEKATRSQVAEVFETAEKMGLKVMRVWAFNDGDAWNALQPRMGHVDERVLNEGLDWVVNEAREFGIRLILTLTDSQGDYGGMAQYVRWAAPLTETIRDFYASKTIRRAFKEYVGAVVLHKNALTGVHYRDDPTIMAWEIANAPVCPGDDSGDLLQDWVEDIAVHVKSLDPNHLVMLGHSGVFGASTPEQWHHNPASLDVRAPTAPWAHASDAVCSGADWVRNHETKHIDVASVQAWPDDWLVAPEPWKLHWSRQWLRVHVEVAQRLKKPLLVSAFSKQRRTAHSSMVSRNAFFQMVYAEAERSNVIAGTLFWLLASNSYPDYDGYTVYSSRVAVQQPPPPVPPFTPEQIQFHRSQTLDRRKFVNWEAMLVCGIKRAMGNTTANTPINPYRPDANAWLDGWADVLDVINSHSQAMARMAGVELSKAALSHAEVLRPRHKSPLLPDGAVAALPHIPEDYMPESDGDSNFGADGSGDNRSDSGAGDGVDAEAEGAAAGNAESNDAGSAEGGADSQGGSTNADEAEADANDAADAAAGAEMAAGGGANPGGGEDLDAAGPAPVLNLTEAAQIDFDDMQAGSADAGGGFLARLSNSVTGALGSVFTSRPAMDDELDEDIGGLAGGDHPAVGLNTRHRRKGSDKDLSLDEQEDEAEGGGLLDGVISWFGPKPAATAGSIGIGAGRGKGGSATQALAEDLAADSLDEAEDSLIGTSGSGGAGASANGTISASGGKAPVETADGDEAAGATAANASLAASTTGPATAGKHAEDSAHAEAAGPSAGGEAEPNDGGSTAEAPGADGASGANEAADAADQAEEEAEAVAEAEAAAAEVAASSKAAKQKAGARAAAKRKANARQASKPKGML